MKSKAAVLIAVLLILSVAMVAVAAEMQKGTIKAVDSEKGTITFCPEGTTTDMTLKADKSVDLGMVKVDTRAEVTVEKGMVKDIKEIKKPRPMLGC
jgi:hypothetical protein